MTHQLPRTLDRQGAVDVEQNIRAFERDCDKHLIEELLDKKTLESLQPDVLPQESRDAERATRLTVR